MENSDKTELVHQTASWWNLLAHANGKELTKNNSNIHTCDHGAKCESHEHLNYLAITAISTVSGGLNKQGN